MAKTRGAGAGIDRRGFVRGAAAGAVLALAPCLRPGAALAFATFRGDEVPAAARSFAFAQLRTRGDWDPEPAAAAALVTELERMTSVEARPGRTVLGPDAPELFSHPFLWLAGREAFAPFSAAEAERLRSWLDAGGTLVADDCSGVPGSGFDASVRRELERIYPGERPTRLPGDHTVMKSFFLLRTLGGRRVVSPFLEGITRQGRTTVVLNPNDLLGAFAKDPLGRWAHPCAPGGERQRRLAFQLGVNLVLYALCSDYKQDRIHLPFLRQRV